MSTRRKSDAITQAVFLTAPTAYFCLVVGFVRTGLILYLAFIISSYMVGFFKRLAEWPLVSKVTLACGPPLLGLGYFFSTQNFTGGMLCRRSGRKRLRWLDRQERSGLSQRDFCARHGLALSTFTYWKRRE